MKATPFTLRRGSSWLLAACLGLLHLILIGSVEEDRAASAAEDPTSGPPRLLAWNDLGMHCLDPDFSVFAILPPFNTINAHLVVGGEIQDSGYTLTYEGIADADGSINTTSVGKTNFWDHVQDLFGASPPVDVGLTGHAMPGAGNVPQAMTFDALYEWYQGEGIPVTPIDDALQKNPYPLMQITAKNGAGQVVATTVTTVPTSTELECSLCHASGASPFARPSAGWAFDPDPLRDDRLNILLLHDEHQLQNPTYTAALAAAGYSAAGLYATATADGTAVLCANCHGSNALPGTGMAGISPLTQAIHSLHASVVAPSGQTLDADTSRNSCFTCHPGRDTQCLRGAMGKAIGPNGEHSMDCQSCHGNLTAVGGPNRVGWLDQPSCQNCHTGTATNNNGVIRSTTAFDATGALQVPADPVFATEADVPAGILSLPLL